MNDLLDTFDIFVDDLLNSEMDLLKGELDLLIMQNIFESIDLGSLKNRDFQDQDSLAA